MRGGHNSFFGKVVGHSARAGTQARPYESPAFGRGDPMWSPAMPTIYDHTSVNQACSRLGFSKSASTSRKGSISSPSSARRSRAGDDGDEKSFFRFSVRMSNWLWRASSRCTPRSTIHWYTSHRQWTGNVKTQSPRNQPTGELYTLADDRAAISIHVNIRCNKKNM